MKKDQVQIGGTYVAKVSGQLAQVRIDRESPYGGWEATNIATRRQVRIKSPRRLRRAVTPAVRQTPTTAAAEPEEYDPDRCYVTDCPNSPVLDHCGRPTCQIHWDAYCAAEAPQDETPETAIVDRGEPNQEMTEMAKKTKTTNGSKKTTKASAATRQPKATKQAKGKVEPASAKEKKTSALDAAALVLRKAGQPMRSQELITAMGEQGLWTSPGGKTPHATLYAAMMREINEKGGASRFQKIERGQFAASGKGE